MTGRTLVKPDVDKAKVIVCALVHFSGGMFEGLTRLNKAFWRAHVYHYRHQDGLLSTYPIARLPEGPAIDDFEDLLISLEREGRIELGQRDKFDYVETTITLKSAPPVLDEDEETSIKNAVEWVKGKSAKQVSHESHSLSIAWQKCKNGELLDIAFDALSDEEVAAAKAQEKKARENVAWAAKITRAMFE